MSERKKNGIRETLPVDMQKTYDIQMDALRGNLCRAMNSKGRNMLQMHVGGLRLALPEMLVAKCADCMAMFADGKIDCQVFSCPIYPRMPYRMGKKRYLRPDRKTEQQAEELERGEKNASS
jgi:hypothetical protein